MTSELPTQTVSFHLRPESGVPSYLQIVQQTRQAVRMGVLNVGDRLPTVKEVVAELAINPNTVQRAYRELEHEGIVEGRQGVGTFVARRPEGPPPGTQARLARALHKWVESARTDGMDDEAMEALLRQTLRGARAVDVA